MSQDIQETRDRCADCNRNAPSQAATPPLPSTPPSTPFESIFADFFDHGGRHYLIVGDRLSSWVEVLSSTAGTDLGGSEGLIRHLRTFFATFGVPEELSSDGGPEFMSSITERFLRTWNVKHRVSSVSFPQSNGRAEVAVKAAKRLLMSNTGPTGSLDQDRFLRAMLQLRNTPDRDCNLSPAEIIFGRPLRDSLSFVNRLEKFTNPHIRPLWRDAWTAKEEALRTRISRTTENLKAHSRPLRPLATGDRVFVQNQRRPNPNKWDRAGLVVESAGNDQYRVKIDGSGRLTLRNRRFLRAYTPIETSTKQRSEPPPVPPYSHQQQPLSPMTDSTVPRTSQDATDRPSAGHPENLSPPSTTTTDQPQSQTTPACHPSEGTNTHTDTPMPDTYSSPLPSQQPPQSRPSRIRRPPKHFEPETGKWIER